MQSSSLPPISNNSNIELLIADLECILSADGPVYVSARICSMDTNNTTVDEDSLMWITLMITSRNSVYHVLNLPRTTVMGRFGNTEHRRRLSATIQLDKAALVHLSTWTDSPTLVIPTTVTNTKMSCQVHFCLTSDHEKVYRTIFKQTLSAAAVTTAANPLEAWLVEKSPSLTETGCLYRSISEISTDFQKYVNLMAANKDK